VAAIHYTVDMRDGSSDGSGPYTMIVRRGATEPADGTALFTGSADSIRNLGDLLAQAYQYIVDYYVSTVETDPDN